MNPEKLAARREAREALKDEARIASEKNQRPVKEMTITIQWVRSKTWGHNPNASVDVYFHNPLPDKYGTFEHKDGYRASGCGYDKESTVIAAIFNDFLKYKLWQLTPAQRKGGNGSLDSGKAPYGIHVYSDNRPHFGGGIGTSCYYKIAEYIGGRFEQVTSGKSFDVYKYTDGQHEKA